MAVEIPVYVNISSGFDAAAAQIPKEMPKLERAISKNVLNIPVYMRGGYKTVQDALLSTEITAKDLKQVLNDITYQFERQAKLEADKSRTSAKVRNLAEAYQLVEQRLTGVYDKANTSSLMLQNSIIKVNAKLKNLRNQLSMAAPGSDAFNKINYQIRIQEQRLLAITKQLEMYRVAGSRAGVQVSSSMQGATASMFAQSGILGRLTSLMGSYLSVAQLGRFIKQIRDVTGELEYQRVALGHLLQDEEYGAELFERIKAAAVESPFRITQLVTYTKQLAAYRIEQENLFDTTKRLADISAGLGVDMNRLILAYGQVRAASVLRGQELRQFTEAGIPLVELLAEKFEELKGEAVSTADVFKLISERAVPFSMIADIFEDLTDKGGMFYKMQEEQAKTLKGRWEKLKDAYDIALQSIGDSESFQRANDVVLGALSMLAKYLRVIPKAINGITASFLSYLVVSKAVALWNNRNAISESRIASQMVRRAFLSGKLTLAEAIRARQSIALAKAEGRLAAATNGVSRAMAKLNIALIKNPWVAAIAAVVGLVVAFTSFRKKADEAASSMHDIEDAIEGMSQANKAHSKIDGLIDRYERLSSKAERSADETLKLTKTTSRLKEALPGAIDVIDNQNLSLEEQSRLLREINDAELERQRTDKEEELDRAETRLKTLQGDMQSAEQEYSRLQKMYLDAKARAEKGAAAINAEYAGTQTRTTTQKELDNAQSKAEEAATAARDAMSSIEQEITKLTTKITRLRNQLYPEEAKKARAEWQNLLIDASKYTSEGVPKELFPSTDVESWTTLGEAIGKLKQQFKDAKTTYEGLVNSVREGGNLVRPTLVQERDAAKDTFDAWQLLDKMLGGLLSTEKPSGRDNRLSQLKSDISELTNAYKKFQELRKYKGEQEALIDIGKMFPQLEGWTPTEDSLVKKLNEMLDKVKSDLARSPKSKTLLDMKRALETEISNIEFDDLKDTLEKKLKNLQDEVKRSETARNFFNNILDLTGDEKLSASLTMEVYGQTGKEFKERVQDEMLGALESAKDLMGKDFFDKMTEDIKIFNVKEIRSQLQLLPEAIRPVFDRLLNEQEKFEADWYQNYYKVYAKSKDYSDRLADNEKKRAQALKEARERGQDTAAVNAFYDKKAAEIQLEAMKDTYTWTKAFENLEGVSTYTLKNLIALIDEYIEKNAKDLEPQQLRELTRSRERAEAQLIERNAFEQLKDAISDYVKAREKKAKLDKDSEEDAEAYAQAADDEADALDRASRAMDKAVGYINELASATKELLSAFASDKDASYYSEQIDNLTKSLAGAAQTAQGVMRLITSEGADPAAYVQTFTGVASFITGIVNAINAARIKKANDEIERQARALSDLEYAYGRLDKAIGDAFGNARIYNYNQQIEILKRKLDALNAQLDAERSKGNKASQDAINGYLDSIRETEAALADLQRLPAEFWAGQELTSASEAFVDSWIAAKKEFGDTASAIEETMQEMVENLVSKAAMSGVVQAVLKPWYEELNKIKSWDASTIARMVQEAYNKIPAINQGLEIAYSSLAAAGVDIRRTVGNLTGISRNYATASEESILGLTAATNTQNYYMSYMPTINDHVAAIRARLVGDGGDDTAAAPEGPTYQDQMLIYASNLPLMRSDTEAIRSMLERVIKPAGTTATHYVSVRM